MELREVDAVVVDDHALALTSFLDEGHLSVAEAYLRDWTWELIETRDPWLGEALVALAPSRLAALPCLFLLREHVLRRLDGADVAQDRALAEFARDLLRRAVGEDRADDGDDGDDGDDDGAVNGWLLRLALLARAATAACEAGDLPLADEAVDAWLTSAGSEPELLDAEIPPGVLGDALLVIQVLVQLDRFGQAKQVAEIAWQLILSPAGSQLDPEGSRVLMLRRVLDLIAGLAGVPNPLPAVGAGSPEPQRELDLVCRGVARAWRSLDEGDLLAAVHHARTAQVMLARPAHWPVVLFVEVLAMIAAGQEDALRALWRDHGAGEPWRSRQHGANPRPIGRLLDAATAGVLAGGTGPESRSPVAVGSSAVGTLAVGNPDGTSSDVSGRALAEGPSLAAAEVRDDVDIDIAVPRVRLAVLLLEALRAHRAGDDDAAGAALLRAYGSGAPAELAPVLLAFAHPREIAALLEIATAMDEPSLGQLQVLASYPGVLDRPAFRLSERELDLLDLIREGMSTTEIAEYLLVSANTVKFHRANLYRKLEARSAEEAVAAAARMGL